MKQETSSPKYLFYKINHLSQLSGSSTLVVTLPSSSFSDHHHHPSKHFLVPIDYEYDDYILYNDGDGGGDIAMDSDPNDDDVDSHQLLLIGVKNEYRDLIDVSRIKNIFSENDCTFIVMGMSIIMMMTTMMIDIMQLLFIQY